MRYCSILGFVGPRRSADIPPAGHVWWGDLTEPAIPSQDEITAFRFRELWPIRLSKTMRLNYGPSKPLPDIDRKIASSWLIRTIPSEVVSPMPSKSDWKWKIRVKDFMGFASIAEIWLIWPKNHAKCWMKQGSIT